METVTNINAKYTFLRGGGVNNWQKHIKMRIKSYIKAHSKY